MTKNKLLKNIKRMLQEFEKEFYDGTKILDNKYNELIEYIKDIKNVAVKNSNIAIDAVNKQSEVTNMQSQIDHNKFMRIQRDLIDIMKRIYALEADKK